MLKILIYLLITSSILPSDGFSEDYSKKYIVIIKEGKSVEDLIQEGVDGREIRIIDELPSINAAIIEFTDGFEVDGDVEDEKIEGIQEDTYQQYINPIEEEDDFETDAIGNGPITPSGLIRIGAGSPKTIDATIAIIDTGVTKDHPNLNVVKHVGFVGGENEYDGNGHGTHVAGTAAAYDNQGGVIGVAPGAKIIALKVLSSQGWGTRSDIVKAIDWVTTHADEVDVVNMSLGGKRGPGIDVEHLAIKKSIEKGVVYVVAAGNEGQNIYYGHDHQNNCIPAAYPEVMTVSAMVDTDGMPGGLGGSTEHGKDDKFAAFTNYSIINPANNPVKAPGGGIDVAAPGSNILSTYLNKSFKKLSGTSMASPHVAGVVARYIAKNRKTLFPNGQKNAKTVYNIRQTLINHAQPQEKWNLEKNANPKSPLHEGLIQVVE